MINGIILEAKSLEYTLNINYIYHQSTYNFGLNYGSDQK